MHPIAAIAVHLTIRTRHVVRVFRLWTIFVGFLYQDIEQNFHFRE